MLIRPSRKSDLIACENIFNLPELATASGNNLPVGYLIHFLNKKYFLVAEINGRVVGAIYGEPLKAGGVMIWAMAVLPEYRGKGIGTKLLKVFEKNAKKDKKYWVVLHASTKTKRTVKFYQKQKYDIGNLYIECAKNL